MKKKFNSYWDMHETLRKIEKMFDSHNDMIIYLKKLGYDIYISSLYGKMVEFTHKTGTKYYFFTNFTYYDKQPIFSFCYKITKTGKKIY